ESLSYQSWVEYDQAGRRWMDISFQPYQNSHQKIDGIVVIARDLTDRKQAEERLQSATEVFSSALSQAEDRLNVVSEVFQAAGEGVVLFDREGIIISANPAFTSMTGHAADTISGQQFAHLFAENKRSTFYDEMWGMLKDSHRWRGEVWSVRHNGEKFPAMLTVTAAKGNSGKIQQHIAVFNDLTDIRKSQEQLYHRTYHDLLTGLPNRELFMDRLDQAIHHSKRSNCRMSVLVCDLDAFKRINDSLGHDCGDMLLREVARRMREVVRSGDTVSRIGGDVLGFVLRDIGSTKDAELVVNKVTKAFSKPFYIKKHTLYCTVSLGAALFPDDGADAGDLVRNAHLAVNHAKEAGRDNFRFYQQEMTEKVTRRRSLEECMRLGLEKEEFRLFYQPKICLKSGRIIGMEALVRWEKQDSGIISPAEFIPIAEETGLIVPLGEWILFEACRQTQEWIDQGHGNLKVAVNLSARQFHQKALINHVQSVLDQTGLGPEHLELEITESLVMHDLDQTIATLDELKAMQIDIAVDDFGTGYSSLSYLKRFPIQTLKIDQSFVRELSADSEDAAIVSAIISLGKNLKLNIVAEGVEEVTQLRLLRDWGCDQVQGYFISRPNAGPEFIKFVAEYKQRSTPPWQADE
ncbi:MAG: EAL domain-containing protein, partial [Magnetococcales bacterium]|nr:EAL domain-containing protein [Magnetococcales bacterium]